MPHETVTLRTCDLIGAALDWAVAKVEEVGVFPSASSKGTVTCWLSDKPKQQYSPSTRWRQGGPLIHSHEVAFLRNSIKPDPNIWLSVLLDGSMSSGPTHLIAACRAIVSAHLGDSVDVPAELVGGGV